RRRQHEGVHQTQGGRLAGAAPADERERLALRDREGETIEDQPPGRGAYGGAVVLDEGVAAHAPKPGAVSSTSIRAGREGASPVRAMLATSLGPSGHSRAASAWSCRRPTPTSNIPPT